MGIELMPKICGVGKVRSCGSYGFIGLYSKVSMSKNPSMSYNSWRNMPTGKPLRNRGWMC